MSLEHHAEKIVAFALEPIGATPQGDYRRYVRLVRRDRRFHHHLVPGFQREKVVNDLQPLHIIDHGDAAQVVESKVRVVFERAADARNILWANSDYHLIDGRAKLYVELLEDIGQSVRQGNAQIIEHPDSNKTEAINPSRAIGARLFLKFIPLLVCRRLNRKASKTDLPRSRSSGEGV